jgi:hypothetical protein
MKVKLVYDDSKVFTVNYSTTDVAINPDVLYYGFVERPGDLFSAARCRVVELDPGETVADWERRS